MPSVHRRAVLASTALAVVLAAGQLAYAASERSADDAFAGAWSSGEGRAPVGTPMVGGSASGLNWSLLGLSSQDDTGSFNGQDVRLGYDNADITIRGKWDNRYKARGGLTFGATLDDAKQQAIGGGFLTNERASEFYGQYQFILPNLDPLSSFTLGEYVTREEQFFTTGGRQVWGYTTYLNWFKRNDGRQSINGDLPPGLRTGLQTLLNNVSALSGTAAYTHGPMVRQGTEGSPRTNALDLSVRGVTPSVLGEFFPVSLGAGVNTAHYDHVDSTDETKVTGNGGAGIAFMGADYFKHSLHWLVGLGADADTRGVYGGTIAAELGPVSVSYRQTTDQQATVLVAWRVSDLWSDKDRQRASTLNVANGNGPLSFISSDRGAGLPDRIAAAENSLMRMGFLPPTGAETTRSSGPSGGSGASSSTATMQLSPVSVAQQPLQVQQAIKRTQELQQQVREQKNADVRSNSSGSGKTAFVGLVRSNNMTAWGTNEIWGTATSITNPNGSTFTGISSDGGNIPVWISGNTVRVNLTNQGCSVGVWVEVYQDGVSIGRATTFNPGGPGGC